MKPLMGALLAAALGTAMLVLGIVGVTGGFEGDESDSGSSPIGIDLGGPASCSAVDSRLSDFNSFTTIGSAGEQVHVAITCSSGTASVRVTGSGLTPEKERTLTLWAWRTRRDAALIETYSQDRGDDGRVMFGGTLPADFARYSKLVVTSEDAGDYAPEKPGEIIAEFEIG